MFKFGKKHKLKDITNRYYNLMDVLEMKDNIIKDLEKEVDKAHDELQSVKDQYMCVLCYDNMKNIILHPCNHFIMCHECYMKHIKIKLEDLEIPDCPVCRKKILKVKKIYE